jgi:hypothetical protein
MRQGKYITTNDHDQERLRNAPMNSLKPVREPNLRADVATPAGSATLVAFIVFLIVILISAWANKNKPLSIDAVFFGALLGLIVWLGVYFRDSGWAKRAIYATEQVVKVDIDGDRFIGEPGHPYTYNTYTQNNKANREKTIWDNWREGFPKFVQYCYDNGTTVTALRRGGFTDNQIDSYRAYMINMGLAAWKGKSHKEGWELIVDEFTAQEKLDRIDWVEKGKQGI